MGCAHLGDHQTEGVIYIGGNEMVCGSHLLGA